MSNKKNDDTLDLTPKMQALLKHKGFTIQKKLNEGSFGQVFKGTNKEGEAIAIKVMFLDKLGEKYQEKFWPRELTALKRIEHKNVVKVYHIIRADGKLFIFMEFADSGDITGFLKSRGPMDEPTACYYFKQASRAIHHMHDVMHMAHRDIKIDNVLLTNNFLVAKVTDFGFVRECHDNDGNIIMSTTYCGTAPYYSPQITARKKYNPYAADCWAMGVMLFCMLNNKFPFHWEDEKKMLKEHMTPGFIKTRYTRKFQEDLKDLQEKFFEPNESKRITMAEVLEHPWILRKGK